MERRAPIAHEPVKNRAFAVLTRFRWPSSGQPAYEPVGYGTQEPAIHNDQVVTHIALRPEDDAILGKHRTRAPRSGGLGKPAGTPFCVIAATRSFRYHWGNRIKCINGQ